MQKFFYCLIAIILFFLFDPLQNAVAKPVLSEEDKILTAYTAFQNEQWAEIPPLLERVQLSSLSPELGNVARWVEAQVALHESRWDNAISFLQPLETADNPFRKAAGFAHLAALKEAHRWEKAREMLETLARWYPQALSADAWTFERAVLDMHTGRAERAIERLKSLFVHEPKFDDDAKVAQLLAEAARARHLPLAALFTAEEWKIRIAQALDTNTVEAAKSAFTMLTDHYGKQLSREYRERTEAEIAFKAKEYAKAIALFKTYRDHAVQAEDRLWAMARLATSYARAGDVDMAIATQKRVIDLAPASAEAGWARYKIAFLKMDNGHFDTALSDFDAVTRSKFKPVYKDALWYAGWCAYQLGRYDVARRYWASLAAADTKSAPRALYWQARGDECGGDASRAMEKYRRLAESARNDYYGYLALLKTSKTALDWESVPPPQGWWAEVPHPLAEMLINRASLPQTPAFEQATFYIEHEIDEAIPQSLDVLESAINTRKETSPRDHVFQFTYPRVWPRWVSQYTRDYKVSPALVYAIMRQESLFKPTVRSPVGAIGLMQLMPSTARRLAKEIPIATFETRDLIRPKTNIRLGTYYLSSLYTTHFNGMLPYAIAAYNAGEEAVARWVKKGKYSKDNWDEFVETIPYGETNNYVKKVLMNYWMYRRLYGL